MKQFLLLTAVFMLLTIFDINAQLDSSITYTTVYDDTIPRWKVIYDMENTYFYEKENDTIDESPWILKARWYDQEGERYYYYIDSVGNERLTYKELWDNGKRYSFWVDSAGNFKNMSYTIYFGYNPEYYAPTESGDNIEFDGLVVTSDQNIITIKATETINDIKIYNIEGALIQKFEPNVPLMKIATRTKGLLILKIRYNENKFAVKKVVMFY